MRFQIPAGGDAAKIGLSLCLLLSAISLAQAGPEIGQDRSVYTNTVLGFRYVPPSAMQDETKTARANVQADASQSRSGKALDLLLALASGSDDTSPSWQTITVESYPRQALSNLDDTAAVAKMSGWVLGLARPVPPTKMTVLSGQSFSVSVFGYQEGMIRRGAIVWTTIRKGSLLSFVFAGNSPEQIKAITETMKSLQFF